MTATKTQKPVRTIRLHDVPGSPGIMLSKDNTYRASRYQSGHWQVEGPNGLNALATSKRHAKQIVHDHQVPKRSTRRARRSK